MMLIYPPNYPATDSIASELWQDVADTAWHRVEITGSECVYRSLDATAALVVEYQNAAAADANDSSRMVRAVYSNRAGADYIWATLP